MRHLSQDEIEERTRDIIANMSILSEQGKISLRGINPEGEYWMILWTDILEEMEIRGAGFRSEFLTSAQLPIPTYPKLPKAKLALGSQSLPPMPYLVKLGHQIFMERMISEGVIRVNPAASFNDASLNRTIRDDELSISVRKLPEDLSVDELREKVPSETLIPPQGFREVVVRSLTNYLVYCMSFRYELRLFDDFQYDACVIVKNPKTFIARVQAKAAEKLPGWRLAVAPVSYIDPLNHGGALPDVFFCKHFRYAYQQEFRLGWLPPRKIDNLDPLDLRLGALDDLAELIVLPHDASP
jgi:hypothetical protein